MATVTLRFWQGVRVPYIGAPGAGVRGTGIPPAGIGRLFDHSAVCVTLSNGNIFWFTTQLPFYIPFTLPVVGFNGQLNLPPSATNGTITNRVQTGVSDVDGQAIIRGLNNWIANGRINVGGHSRALWNWEVNNSFSMVYWAGMFSGCISDNQGTDNLWPNGIIGIPSRTTVVRIGSQNVIPSDTVLVVGSLNGINMVTITPRGRTKPNIYKFKRCNTNSLIRSIRLRSNPSP